MKLCTEIMKNIWYTEPSHYDIIIVFWKENCNRTEYLLKKNYFKDSELEEVTQSQIMD